jgi:tetratricopeptide (TPR) repeat protein
VNNEELYQMALKVYREQAREQTQVVVNTVVTNFAQKAIVDRTVKLQNVAMSVLETLQYETAVVAKNEFDIYLDAAFSGTGDVVEKLQPSAAGYIERGLANIEIEAYDLALADFAEALKLEPKNAAAFYYSGDVYYYQDDYDAAISYYTQAININPVPVAEPDFDAYYMRGICYNFGTENYDMAIADFNRSEKLRPNNARLYFERGFAYLMQDLYPEAMEDLTKSIKLNSKNSQAYYFRALVYSYDKGTKRKAIADCKKALAINSNYKYAKDLLAKLQEKKPFDWSKLRNDDPWLGFNFSYDNWIFDNNELNTTSIGVDLGFENFIYFGGFFGVLVSESASINGSSIGGSVGYRLLNISRGYDWIWFSLSVSAGAAYNSYSTESSELSYDGNSSYFIPYAQIQATLAFVQLAFRISSVKPIYGVSIGFTYQYGY